MLTDTFKTSFKRLLKYQSLLKELNRSLNKMKKQLKLEMNMRLLNKSNLLSKKLLSLKNSKKQSETSITLRKSYKLLIDMSKPQSKSQFKNKN